LILAHQGRRNLHQERDLIHRMTVAGVDHHHGEGDHVVGDGGQGMMNTLPNLGEGVALQVQFHCLHTVAEGPTRVLLLGTQRHDDVPAGQRLQVPTDGTQTTVEDAKGEVLGGQQRALVQRLVGHAHHLPPAQSGHTFAPLGKPVGVVFLSRVEGQNDWDHLALRERLVAWLVGRDGGEEQLSGLDCLWSREPGEVDFLDQVGEGLGLELGAA